MSQTLHRAAGFAFAGHDADSTNLFFELHNRSLSDFAAWLTDRCAEELAKPETWENDLWTRVKHIATLSTPVWDIIHVLGNGQLLVVPPELSDRMVRRNDDLDFVFAVSDDHHGEQFSPKPLGFHPYRGRTMDAATGVELNGHGHDLLACVYERPDHRPEAAEFHGTRVAPVDGGDRLYADSHEAIRSVRPYMPGTVNLVLEFAGITADSATSIPALAQWWD